MLLAQPGSLGNRTCQFNKRWHSQRHARRLQSINHSARTKLAILLAEMTKSDSEEARRAALIRSIAVECVKELEEHLRKAESERAASA